MTQKWYGYEKYYLTGNKYITSGSNIIQISIIISG